jgi:hypothetical protein
MLLSNSEPRLSSRWLSGVNCPTVQLSTVNCQLSTVQLSTVQLSTVQLSNCPTVQLSNSPQNFFPRPNCTIPVSCRKKTLLKKVLHWFNALQLSAKVYTVLAVVVLLIFFTRHQWTRGKVMEEDIVQYYSFLPAVVIHHDITMSYAAGNPFYGDKIWGTIWKDGFGPVQKYTMGMSWLYLPFFMAGHGSALALGYPPDGYSVPYKFWMLLGAIFYLLIGLHWLRKVLLLYFSETVTALVILILPLGTNLFYYSFGNGCMPHVYLLALVSLLMLLTIRFYAHATWKAGLLLAVVCSIITLIRPNHLLFWAVPGLYGITSWESLLARLRFWRIHWLKLAVWPMVLAVIVFPQLLYWRHMTDHWIYYSYRDEHFFWGDPKIGKVLFGFRNGWLIYSPIMILGVGGMVLLWKYVRAFAVVVPLIFLIATYVIASWWCWWYGGSFGNRVYIDFYPLLALGMGALFTWVLRWNWSRPKRIVGLALIGFFFLLNGFQTLQHLRGIIHYDSMTAKAYLRSFGRLHMPPDYETLLDAPNYNAAKLGDR